MKAVTGSKIKEVAIKFWPDTGVDNMKIPMVAQGRNNKLLIVTGSLHS